VHKLGLYTCCIGGVKIKLKMGKGEDKSAEQSADESSDSKEETPTEEATPKDDEEKPAEAPIEPAPEVKEEVAEEDEEKKKNDAEALRKVIKVDSGGDDAPAAEEDDPADLVEDDAGDDDIGGSASRESLEQKRAILQSIKDFDFQIKKNQEDVTGVNQKLDGMSKDLDDLVSLYEIVSEQMNPFVGLSKVTKKRLDALENFTKEIDMLKDRTGELESFAERSGAKIQNIAEGKAHADTIDTDALLGKEGEVTGEGEIAIEESDNGEVTAEDSGELSAGETVPEEQQAEEISEPEVSAETVDTPTSQETFTMETQQPFSITIPVEDNGFGSLSDAELDMILDKAFGSLSPTEGKVDMLIDEFIESLKG